MLITLLLTRYSDDYFAIFGLSAILCGSLEYFTSYLMEKLFKARWWDYSNEKFNINGRICLTTIFLFAIAGIGIIKILNPFFEKYISIIPQELIDIVTIVFSIVFLIDVIISINVMNKIKNISVSVKTQLKDSTEEISIRVRNIISEKSMPYRRILEAFPNAFISTVRTSKEKLVQAAETVKGNVIVAKEKTIENINNIKEKTVENINVVKEKTINGVNSARHETAARVRLIGMKANKEYNNLKNAQIVILDKSRIERIKEALNNKKIKTIDNNKK